MIINFSTFLKLISTEKQLVDFDAVLRAKIEANIAKAINVLLQKCEILMDLESAEASQVRRSEK